MRPARFHAHCIPAAVARVCRPDGVRFVRAATSDSARTMRSLPAACDRSRHLTMRR